MTHNGDYVLAVFFAAILAFIAWGNLQGRSGILGD
jgi:hypothetical protein